MGGGRRRHRSRLHRVLRNTQQNLERLTLPCQLHASTMSIHHIEEVQSGYAACAALSIRWNNARLVVHLDPSPVGNSIEDDLIKWYNAACTAEDHDEEAVSDQTLDRIVEARRSIFDQLAPPTASSSPDLNSLIFPAEYTFRF